MRFGVTTANNDEVLVDHTGRSERDGERAEIALRAGIAFCSGDPESLTEVYVAAFAKGGDEVAGIGVDAIEEIHDAGINATLLAVIPIRETARGLSGNNTGI